MKLLTSNSKHIHFSLHFLNPFAAPYPCSQSVWDEMNFSRCENITGWKWLGKSILVWLKFTIPRNIVVDEIEYFQLMKCIWASVKNIRGWKWLGEVFWWQGFEALGSATKYLLQYLRIQVLQKEQHFYKCPRCLSTRILLCFVTNRSIKNVKYCPSSPRVGQQSIFSQ